MRQTVARLEEEAAEEKQRSAAQAEELKEERAALRRMTARAEGAEESTRYTEENARQSGNEAELERLRAVADEKRKWEKRVARDGSTSWSDRVRSG